MSEIERTPRGDVDLALPLNLPPHLLTIPSHSVRLDLLPGTMFGGLSKGQVSVTATQVMSRGGYEGKINGESNGGALHRARQHSVASYSRMGPSAPSSPIRVVTHRGGAWFHSQHVALLTPPAPPLTRAQLNGHSKVFVETSSDVILSRK
uniref:Uncharacterized protein n=1 Tax=Arundo donax TaxID=35708 RepID=A0A0A9E8U5_ARUDO